jgi:dihydroneopterin aldolase
MTDHLRLINMTFYGRHGVHAHERELGRTISVDVDLTLDLSAAGRSDDLAAGVDYSAVYAAVKEAEAAGPYHLLEALAEAIAGRLLQGFPEVEEVLVRARKREPSVGGWVESAEVEIVRKQKKT